MSRGSVVEAQDDCGVLFGLLEQRGRKEVTKEMFVQGLGSLPYIDVSEVEAARMFDSLTDTESENVKTLRERESIKLTRTPSAEKHLTLAMLKDGVTRWRWLRSMLKVFSAFQRSRFKISDDYDYTKSTVDNYGVDDRTFTGVYADIRETRDYGWHRNFSATRQRWQDLAIKTCLGKTEAQARPWVVYTCGPMGVGKGHVLNWLSAKQLFPLEYIVHVDPDFFKSIMPEWTHYRDLDEENAGSFCHAESTYLQEIAMESALRQRQHVLVDGSLSDGEWFSQVFDDIRARFPHYRIAIIYITASEEVVRQRIHQRSLKTGRMVPESQILRSLRSPEKSISILAPKTDLVVRIVNEEKIELKSVEDHSGSWYRGLQKHFGSIAYQRPPFPAWLGPIYLEQTSIVGDAVDDEEFKPSGAHLRPTCKEHMIKKGISGELFMQSNKSLQWKLRYFELANGTLRYFRIGEGGTEAFVLRGEVPINAFTTLLPDGRLHVNAVAPETGEQLQEPPTSFLFSLCGINTAGEPYVFHCAAPRENIRTQWLTALQNQLDDAKEKILCAGLMDKQGQIFASWKTRFFILSHGKLSYYTSEEDKSLRGEVIITHQSTVSGKDIRHSGLQSTGILSDFLHNKEPDAHYVILTGKKSDGSKVSLNCLLKTAALQDTWTKAIQKEIDHCKRVINLERGFYSNSFEDVRLTEQATRNSPNLQQLKSIIPNMTLHATKIVRSTIDISRGDDQKGVSYLRWLFPRDGIESQLSGLKNVNMSDPDVCLLRYGGLLEYSESGVVKGARAIVDHQTMEMVEFGEPERLEGKDAERLHAGERWKAVTNHSHATSGARFYTFILPHENLVSRRFPKFGCFAFLFRDLDEVEDPRDRYFPLLGDSL